MGGKKIKNYYAKNPAQKSGKKVKSSSAEKSGEKAEMKKHWTVHKSDVKDASAVISACYECKIKYPNREDYYKHRKTHLLTDGLGKVLDIMCGYKIYLQKWNSSSKTFQLEEDEANDNSMAAGRVDPISAINPTKNRLNYQGSRGEDLAINLDLPVEFS
ncbi:uncharacterized protein G2W53_013452 [Senna tora]|uniref:C2H2-type domain-containing protein n=1 Tax=Senna tora TaxID=362788 RepID=A0A834U4I2_9FABA|nr:uncharacterized protein G2W53_013452 [Senna tora]